MNELSIDWFTVVIAAILNMVIGFFWYSKWLFGPVWMKEHAVKGEYRNTTMLYAALVSLITAYFLAFFEAYMGVTSVSDGLFVGFCAWLGFIATTQISSVIWGVNTLRGFWIDTGYKLLSFLVMSGVIGA